MFHAYFLLIPIIDIILLNSDSYPLLNIPLPGTIPTKIVLPYTVTSPAVRSNPHQHTNTNDDAGSTVHSAGETNAHDVFHMNNLTFEQPFPWASDDPFIYIQQIVMRTSVVPWTKDLLLTDAYRAPLYEVFKLLEIVRNHEDENR